MVSLEQPRALAAGAINPLDSMSASAICCGVYLRYGARGPALTSSAMLTFLSFFEVAKVSNLLINSDCSTPYVLALWRDMCSAESPAAPLSRSALRQSRSYRPYPTTPPYPRHDAAPALLRARPLALGDGLPGPRREAQGSPAPTPAPSWVGPQPSPGLPAWRLGLARTASCGGSSCPAS